MHNHARIAGNWFRAAEATGDDMGIRYGRGEFGSDEIEWSWIPHADCDGIGGFARLLRRHGSELSRLPATSHPTRSIFGPLWKLWRNTGTTPDCAGRNDWNLQQETRTNRPTAVAWKVFSEATTTRIRQHCRSHALSVNSYLLKHLDQAVRPSIHKPEARIPWMIPVNLRGSVRHADDTANHVSYVTPRIHATDTASTIHHQIHQRLKHGEHRANYLLMIGLGKVLSLESMIQLIHRDRQKPAGNIGAFSNLGNWQSGTSVDRRHFWLFCPPVAQGQLLGAGCVTYQGRLSLTLQTQASLPAKPALAKQWMQRWSNAVEAT